MPEKHKGNSGIAGKVALSLEGLLLNDHLRSFIKSLGVVFVFKVASFIISIVVSVLIAHSLGPAGVGIIGVVQAAVNFLVIPMIMGASNSLCKYLPSSDANEKKVIMSTVMIINFLLVVVFSFAYLAISPLITDKFKVMSGDIWLYSILLAVIVNFGFITEGAMRGNKSFYQIGAYRFISFAFFLVMIVFMVFIRKSIDLQSYFTILCIYQAIFALLAFRHLGIKPTAFSSKHAVKMYNYGIINMLSWTLSTIVFGVDIFIVKYFCSPYDLGIFSAYLTNAKAIFNVLFFELLLVVFLPTIADMDKKELCKKLDKYSPVLFPIFIVCSSLIICVIILLFGREFPLKPEYVFCTALGMTSSGICQLYVAVISMEGNMGARLWLLSIALSAPLLILIQFVLIRSEGVNGAVMSYALINLMLLVFVRTMIFFKFRN